MRQDGQQFFGFLYGTHVTVFLYSYSTRSVSSYRVIPRPFKTFSCVPTKNIMVSAQPQDPAVAFVLQTRVNLLRRMSRAPCLSPLKYWDLSMGSHVIKRNAAYAVS